jgi:MFS family permease
VAAFAWFIFGAPAGVLADRFGPRRVAVCGIGCLVAALWLASLAGSVGMLYVTYSIGIGVGVGLVYVPSVGAVQPWFSANRALASGLAVAGIGAGNFAVPLLAAWWIELYGWRNAFVGLAFFALVLGGVAALVIDAPARESTAPRAGTPLREALRSREFALLYAAMVFSCVGIFVPMVHIAPYAQDLGYSEAQGVALVSLIGLGSLIGRFTVGPFADRLGRRRSLVALCAALALFATVFGMCYGSTVALLPTIVMDLYGARAVSGIIGFLYTGAGIGTLIGPWLAGAAYDALGTYDVPILAGAAFAFLAALSGLPLVKSEKAEIVHRG